MLTSRLPMVALETAGPVATQPDNNTPLMKRVVSDDFMLWRANAAQTGRLAMKCEEMSAFREWEIPSAVHWRAEPRGCEGKFKQQVRKPDIMKTYLLCDPKAVESQSPAPPQRNPWRGGGEGISLTNPLPWRLWVLATWRSSIFGLWPQR